MYSKSTLLFKWLRYYLAASNGKGHGVHSPFVFDFITRVLNDKKKYPAYAAIEKRRHELLADHNLVEVDDFGAGSAVGLRKNRTVSDIARHSAKSPKWGQLLFRMAHFYRPHTMLELGTSLGISSAYLASGNPDAKLLTLEGAAAVAAIAKENFLRLGLENIELIGGSFDNSLPGAIVSIQSEKKSGIGLAFVDGNHRLEPTLRYFEELLPAMADSSVIIFDDIHWSGGMEKAWKQICADGRVMLSVDLFFVGLIFFRKEFKVKQHFSLRHGL